MTLADAVPDGARAPREAGTLLGHRKGLAYLAFTEAWERFSYYGMTALLVLYDTLGLRPAAMVHEVDR